MPQNSSLTPVILPMDLKFNEEPTTMWMNNLEALNVELVDARTYTVALGHGHGVVLPIHPDVVLDRVPVGRHQNLGLPAVLHAAGAIHVINRGITADLHTRLDGVALDIGLIGLELDVDVVQAALIPRQGVAGLAGRRSVVVDAVMITTRRQQGGQQEGNPTRLHR